MLMTEQPKQIALRRLARRVALAVALAVTAVPLLAQAQRKSPLADAPAIRKRFELRSTRLELGVGVGSTINQDFYHTVLIDLAARRSTSPTGSRSPGSAASPSRTSRTGFQSKVVGSLGDTTPTLAREPTPAEAAASMEKINDRARRAARVHAVHGQVLDVRQAVRRLRLLPVRRSRPAERQADQRGTNLRSGRADGSRPASIVLCGDSGIEVRRQLRRRLPHLLQPVARRSTSSCATSSPSSTRRAATSTAIRRPTPTIRPGPTRSCSAPTSSSTCPPSPSISQ